MIIDIVKEAFDEGREFGGEWEDSDAYEISKLLPFLDIENLTFQQRLPNGQFGKVFKGVNEVKKYVSSVQDKVSETSRQITADKNRAYVDKQRQIEFKIYQG